MADTLATRNRAANRLFPYPTPQPARRQPGEPRSIDDVDVEDDLTFAHLLLAS